MLLAADSPVTWTTPTIVVSILAPIVALVGVLLSNWWSARTTREAENNRAQNAIDAENIRAASAIAAEDRRHENAQEQSASAWVRGARGRAFFGVIASTTQVVLAAENYVWFLRPKGGLTGDDGALIYEPASVDSAGEQIPLWNAAASEIRRLDAEIRAVGNPEIGNLANDVRYLSGRVMDLANKASMRPDVAVSFRHEEVARKKKRKMRRAHRKMIALIRAELGAEPTSADLLPQGAGAQSAPDVASTAAQSVTRSMTSPTR